MKPFQWFAVMDRLHMSFLREQRKVKMSIGPTISAGGRNIVLAAVASLALAASASPSRAASTTPANAVAGSSNASAVTDFSAARRHRYYRRGPSAAGLAFMGAATGLIAGAIAESQRREYYENNYYYGGPRTYYDRGYGYYGGPGNYYRPY